MRLKPEQLTQHLLNNPLAPVYLVTGDEPQQICEITDAIRMAANRNGYLERTIFSYDLGFSWQDLQEAKASTSLFNDKKIIDLRLGSQSPGKDGSRFLVEYGENPPDDTLLLITAAKLPAASQANWTQALDRAGVIIQVWPLEGPDLLRWLQSRLKYRGMSTDNEGLKLLSTRVEGNLLAAAQEIEKLYALFGEGGLTCEKIADAVADNSRYDVFKLVDSLLSGNAARIVKVLNGLKSEDIALPVILWAISRELRLLCKIERELATGKSWDAAAQYLQVGLKKKVLMTQGIGRIHKVNLHRMLAACAKADREIKGQQAGDPWQTILQICLSFATKAR